MIIKVVISCLFLLLGWILGIITVTLLYNSGELIVYRTDEYDNVPNLFLNLDNKNPDKLLRQKHVLLTVKQNFVNYTFNADYISNPSSKVNSR